MNRKKKKKVHVPFKQSRWMVLQANMPCILWQRVFFAISFCFMNMMTCNVTLVPACSTKQDRFFPNKTQDPYSCFFIFPVKKLATKKVSTFAALCASNEKEYIGLNWSVVVGVRLQSYNNCTFLQMWGCYHNVYIVLLGIQRNSNRRAQVKEEESSSVLSFLLIVMVLGYTRVENLLWCEDFVLDGPHSRLFCVPHLHFIHILPKVSSSADERDVGYGWCSARCSAHKNSL